MLNLSKNHALLAFVAFLVFFGLSTLIAIFPALDMQNSVQPLSKAVDLTPKERKGLSIYVAEGCVACHTQQVRNIEMDKVWGDRPSLPSDYYFSKKRMDVWRQSPSLLGSERTGPDLTNVGKRQPSQDWHLIHLYNPRIVVDQSVMPAYPWLFELKSASEVGPTDVKVNVPKRFKDNSAQVVVAKEDALNLVKYIQSLKQVDPSFAIPEFIPSSQKEVFAETSVEGETLDGKSLYVQNCAACHQPSGEGLAGAFPSLKNSTIVTDENYDFMVRIIIQGYDARDEYGVMPGLGEQLNDAEIAAIVNYERNSWGNEASRITKDDVKRIREFVNALDQ